MTILSASIPQNFGLIFIAASAIAFYVAARVAVDSLTNLEHPSPARLALAHWIPVAFVAIISVITGYPIIGVCVVFGTCVAALTLNLGLITATTGDEVGTGEFSRAWPFLIPAALIAFVAGFSAALNWMHAIVLAIEAVMIAIVWFAPTPRAGPQGGFPVIPLSSTLQSFDLQTNPLTPNSQPSNPHPNPDFHPTTPPLNHSTTSVDPHPTTPSLNHFTTSPLPDPMTPRRWLTLSLAIIISILAAIVGVFGAYRMSQEIPLTTPGLIAAVGLSPLLLLPMIGTGTLLAERRQATVAATSLVALTLLNLCVLLPLMVLTCICRGLILSKPEFPAHIPFPIAAWRVDTVLILIAGALLIPVALGRWRLGRAEGVILVITYAAYLAATSILAVRW